MFLPDDPESNTRNVDSDKEEKVLVTPEDLMTEQPGGSSRASLLSITSELEQSDFLVIIILRRSSPGVNISISKFTWRWWHRYQSAQTRRRLRESGLLQSGGSRPVSLLWRSPVERSSYCDQTPDISLVNTHCLITGSRWSSWSYTLINKEGQTV